VRTRLDELKRQEVSRLRMLLKAKMDSTNTQSEWTGGPVEARWRPGGGPVESRWRPGGGPVESRWRPGGGPVEARWRPGGEQVESRWRPGGGLVESWLQRWLLKISFKDLQWKIRWLP